MWAWAELVKISQSVLCAARWKNPVVVPITVGVLQNGAFSCWVMKRMRKKVGDRDQVVFWIRC